MGSEDISMMRRDTVADDEVFLFSSQNDFKATVNATIPDLSYAYLKFGYDKTIKLQLEKDNVEFSDWVDKIMTHVQCLFRLPSLPTKIEFKVQIRVAKTNFYHVR